MINLIDRNALMERMEKICEICKSKHMDREYGGCSFCGMTGAIGEVKRAPAVNVPPVWHSANETPVLNTEEVIAIDGGGAIFSCRYESDICDQSKFGYWKDYYDKDTLGFLESEWVPMDDIIAWMYIPECPYADDSTENDIKEENDAAD